MFVRGRQRTLRKMPLALPYLPCLELLEGGVARVAGGEVIGEGRPDRLVARVARIVARERAGPDFVAPMLVFRDGVAKNPRRRDEDCVAGNRSSAMCVCEVIRETKRTGGEVDPDERLEGLDIATPSAHVGVLCEVDSGE